MSVFHSLEGSFRHSRFMSLLSKALELVLFLSPKCLLRMLLDFRCTASTWDFVSGMVPDGQYTEAMARGSALVAPR